MASFRYKLLQYSSTLSEWCHIYDIFGTIQLTLYVLALTLDDAFLSNNIYIVKIAICILWNCILYLIDLLCHNSVKLVWLLLSKIRHLWPVIYFVHNFISRGSVDYEQMIENCLFVFVRLNCIFVSIAFSVRWI